MKIGSNQVRHRAGSWMLSSSTVAGVASEKLRKSSARYLRSAEQVVRRIHEIGSVAAVAALRVGLGPELDLQEKSAPAASAVALLGRSDRKLC